MPFARLHDLLDTLVAADICFAIFREQYSSDERGVQPRLIVQADGRCRIVPDLSRLEERGFLLAPFQQNPTTPIVFIREDMACQGWANIENELEQFMRVHSQKEILSPGEHSPAPPAALLDNSEPTSAYRKAFSAFSSSVRDRQFSKLVLSRGQEIDGFFSPAGAFLRACSIYPNAMVALVHTTLSGTWVCATPETLLAGSGGQWRTMALAGSRPEFETGPWDKKNLEEQLLVTQYIQQKLSRFPCEIHKQGPCTVIAGDIRHLRTDFHFRPGPSVRTADIVRALHPTPAVCGLPPEEAKEFICRNEGHDRRYYAGFLGWWGGRDEASLYVNLRCMEMQPSFVTLHAGGGILPASRLEKEWRETCGKMHTMLRLL